MHAVNTGHRTEVMSLNQTDLSGQERDVGLVFIVGRVGDHLHHHRGAGPHSRRRKDVKLIQQRVHQGRLP